MRRFLQSGPAVFLAGFLSFTAAAVATWQQRAPVASESWSLDVSAGPSWTFHNPEVDLLIDELKREQEAMASREAELKALENRLRAEQEEIGRITNSIDRLQRELDASITRVREEEIVNLRRLAKLYSNMTPEGAAAVFRELDDEAVVKLMLFMRENDSAPILELLARSGEDAARRVAGISEQLRRAILDTKQPGAR